MSSVVGSIVEEKVAMAHAANGDFGNTWLKTNSAGSGAFVLKSWKANESVVMDAFPGYRGGAPTIKRVVVRHVPEPATQRLLIEKGDVDIAENLTPDQIAGTGWRQRRRHHELASSYAGLRRPQREDADVRECEGQAGGV